MFKKAHKLSADERKGIQAAIARAERVGSASTAAMLRRQLEGAR